MMVKNLKCQFGTSGLFIYNPLAQSSSWLRAVSYQRLIPSHPIVQMSAFARPEISGNCRVQKTGESFSLYNLPSMTTNGAFAEGWSVAGDVIVTLFIHNGEMGANISFHQEHGYSGVDSFIMSGKKVSIAKTDSLIGKVKCAVQVK